MPSPRRDADATRGALLAAARDRFGRAGFAATTVREIALDAGVDPALIVRYFGGKRGLYDAAVQVDLHLPDFGDVDPDDLGRAVVATFLDRWDGAAGEPLRVLLGAAGTDTEAAARLRATFEHQVRPALTAAGETHRATGHLEVIVATLIGLATLRYTVRVPEVMGLSREQIVDRFAPTIQWHLTGARG
ncbi:TetR/AcrR family transcriptional regulator [Williamsia deligens]|uniref:TetR/AcrR family transcriptional regulator n=1 Tax=Williamsia deligens TaxID=321325 RepID=A0ABW3G1C0_9NOCA|nr:TetR family transcriptional regulator [Williamsia deligens]MCP2194945.1 transcriptional regulator, TetR family [Williamsia deligens]